MRFTRQSRPITQHHEEGVDLELRAPRMKIAVRNERHQWWVDLSWLTDRRRWKIAYAWKVWGREAGVELAEFLIERFSTWEPWNKGVSPIPAWLKECAKAGIVVPMERLILTNRAGEK